MLRALVLLSALVSFGCAHSIHQVHVSDFRPAEAIEAGEVVKAKAEQFSVLGIVQETNYINVAYQELQNKCRGGEVTGITTQLSTSLGFLSWTHKVLMQGLCVK
jgi:hypothetical protein